MDVSSIKLNSLEKAMQARWALVFITSVAFMDAYMMIRHGHGLLVINVAWVKLNVDLLEAVFVVGAFTMGFGLIIPGISFVGRILIGTFVDTLIHKITGRYPSTVAYRRAEDSSDRSDYVHKEVFREWSIKTSNSAAYRDYELFEVRQNEILFTRYLCQSFLTLSVIAWLFSSTENPSLLEAIYGAMGALPWYQAISLKTIWAGFGLFLFGIAFQDEDFYRNYIPLRQHGIERSKLTISCWEAMGYEEGKS